MALRTHKCHIPDGYSLIPNWIARDPNLTEQARGTLVRLLSMGDGWDVSISLLAAACPDGTRKIRTGLSRLEDNGYLSIGRGSGPGGRYGGEDWHVYMNPADNTRWSEQLSVGSGMPLPGGAAPDDEQTQTEDREPDAAPVAATPSAPVSITQTKPPKSKKSLQKVELELPGLGTGAPDVSAVQAAPDAETALHRFTFRGLGNATPYKEPFIKNLLKETANRKVHCVIRGESSDELEVQTDSIQPSKTKHTRGSYSGEFNTWWLDYAKTRTSKKKTYKHWLRLMRAGVEPATLAAASEHYRLFCDAHSYQRDRVDPERFLNTNDLWEQHVEPPTKAELDALGEQLKEPSAPAAPADPGRRRSGPVRAADVAAETPEWGRAAMEVSKRFGRRGSDSDVPLTGLDSAQLGRILRGAWEAAGGMPDGYDRDRMVRWLRNGAIANGGCLPDGFMDQFEASKAAGASAQVGSGSPAIDVSSSSVNRI